MKDVLCVKVTLNEGEAYAYIDENNVPIDNEEKIKQVVEDLEHELCYPIGIPGTRNNCAVNISCMLYALGIEDPWSWLCSVDCMARSNDEHKCLIRVVDQGELRRCFKRVEPYLESWNRNPEKGSILGYTVDY